MSRLSAAAAVDNTPDGGVGARARRSRNTSPCSPERGSFAACGEARTHWEIDTKRLDDASRWLEEISKRWARGSSG